jgi:hypothetical protein
MPLKNLALSMEKYNREQYIKGIIYPNIVSVLDEFRVDASMIDLTYKNRTHSVAHINQCWVSYIQNYIDISTLPYVYTTHGSTESIYKIIASSGNSDIGIFKKSYIGYSETAKMFNKNIIYLDNIFNSKSIIENLTVIISIPDTVTGSWITNDIIEVLEFLKIYNCKIWIDVALLGTMISPIPNIVNTLLTMFPNICGIFGSCSKTFGLNHIRQGFLMSNTQFVHLEDNNKWFPDNLSIGVISEIFKIPNLTKLPEYYYETYTNVCQQLHVVETDCILLGLNYDNKRICITPDIHAQLHGPHWDNDYTV